VDQQLWIDFDGTLVVPNVAVVLVEEFGRDGARVARETDEQLHRGEITLRQAWERELAVLPADRIEEMAAYARDHTPLRAGAQRLVEVVKRRRIPTAVVSGGVDFYIHPVLERERIDWPVFSDSLIRGRDGQLKVAHPHGHATCRLCGICKAQLVLGGSGRSTIFVGDGSTDRFAAEVADTVFARHRLLAYCQAHGIEALPFESLDTVADWLESANGGTTAPDGAGRRGLPGSPCPISREVASASGSGLDE
jgi:2-hydroxy-3-keto-5-methylthiopentenyl-1-phosphate phosphatase